MISRKALFDKVRELCASGWHDLPDTGTGAPGDHLENMLGLKTSNHDGPDAGLWELKFSRGSALITLFHKTPRPRGSMKFIINKFGWPGSRNRRQSFRHTLEGERETDRGFRVVYDAGAVWVRHKDAMTIAPHWTEDDLLNAAGGKLRRLVLVEGSVRRRPYQVRYDRAAAYEQFKLSRFMEAISTGLVRVDFDAYIQESGAVRDHGVKFRVKPENLRRLYDKSERL